MRREKGIENIDSAETCRERCYLEGGDNWTFDTLENICYIRNVPENGEDRQSVEPEKPYVVIYGSDCPGGTFSTVNTPTHQLCRLRCEDNEKCVQWSYDDSQNKCYLKDTYQSCQVKSRNTSGIFIPQISQSPILWNGKIVHKK
jgi:hypothetical protein